MLDWLQQGDLHILLRYSVLQAGVKCVLPSSRERKRGLPLPMAGNMGIDWCH